MEDAVVVPSTCVGGTDNRFLRQQGIAAYGFIPRLLSSQRRWVSTATTSISRSTTATWAASSSSKSSPHVRISVGANRGRPARPLPSRAAIDRWTWSFGICPPALNQVRMWPTPNGNKCCLVSRRSPAACRGSHQASPPPPLRESDRAGAAALPRVPAESARCAPPPRRRPIAARAKLVSQFDLQRLGTARRRVLGGRTRKLEEQPILHNCALLQW